MLESCVLFLRDFVVVSRLHVGASSVVEFEVLSRMGVHGVTGLGRGLLIVIVER